MIKTYIIEPGDQLTEEMIREVEESARKPITFDEDCPELSPAMMKAFKFSVIQRNKRKRV